MICFDSKFTSKYEITSGCFCNRKFCKIMKKIFCLEYGGYSSGGGGGGYSQGGSGGGYSSSGGYNGSSSYNSSQQQVCVSSFFSPTFFLLTYRDNFWVLCAYTRCSISNKIRDMHHLCYYFLLI